MSAIKVKVGHFTGTSKVFSRDPDGLAAIIRALAVDNARLKVEATGVNDFTDNSTGTAGSLVALPVPATKIDATSAGGAQATALNTSLGKVQNAGKVITNTLNEARALLGLPALVSASGTQATADTIPAQDLAATAGVGVAASTFASVAASAQVAADNFYKLAEGANEVLAAIGVAQVALPKVPRASGVTLAAIPAVTVGTGPNAAKASEVTAFLAAYANNVATLAAAWNAAMSQGTPGALHVVAG